MELEMTVHDVMMEKKRMITHLIKHYVGATFVITLCDIHIVIVMHLSNTGCEEKRCGLTPFAVVEPKSPKAFAAPMLLDDYCE